MSVLSTCCRRGYAALAKRCTHATYTSAHIVKGPGFAAHTRTHSNPSTSKNRKVCNSTSQPGCGPQGKYKVVFLGTPEISAVVTQPARPKGRGNTKTPVPSPVQQLAEQQGIAKDKIFTPVTAKEDAFLEALRCLAPDLCVTAAYGNILPKRFLEIPRFGTLNIHPSLLPKYRGAAPVQRSLQDGVSETGVSVLFTVFKCDAGPVLAQRRMAVPLDIQAPQLLDRLFMDGAELLISCLPEVFAGRGAELAVPQDESQATHASKMDKEEGLLDFSLPALALHNKVRAFAGWPGTFARLTILDEVTGKSDAMELKVLRTKFEDGASCPPGTVTFIGDALLVGCGDGRALQVLDIQVPTKKPSTAKEFKNGLGRKSVLIAQQDALHALAQSSPTLSRPS